MENAQVRCLVRRSKQAGLKSAPVWTECLLSSSLELNLIEVTLEQIAKDEGEIKVVTKLKRDYTLGGSQHRVRSSEFPPSSTSLRTTESQSS